MTQKQNGVLEWLQSCETPAPSEPKIEAVIVAGKSYMNSSEFNKNSMRDIILNQLQFLPLSFWIIQIILTICAVLLACILGQWRVPFYYPLTILAVMVPFLALLGAIEISKSNIYGMWEIEQSSRTTLVKIVAGRMLIIGVINLFLITVILISMAYIYQKSMIEMVLYGLIPIRENTSTVLEKRKNDWRIDMELTINDLSKEYGRKKAVNHFSAKLTNGVYGLLGANGAGKTTLMRMICDVQTETKGAIFFNGKNIHDLGEKYRNILGYLPQNFGYYPNFTAYKFLMYISAIKGLPPKKAHNRTMELLQVVDLLTQKNEKIKTFSGGMKQRLGIAQALLNDPRILILDEPTAGLDPKERVRFRNLISSLAENKIVILSTHIVSDVEYIANEILIMKNGELIQHGSPEEILKPIEKCVWECDVSRKEAEELELNYVTANLKHNNGAERLRIISQEAPCRTAWNVDPTLEDLYLYYFAEVSEHE